jgi:hypothetical protein
MENKSYYILSVKVNPLIADTVMPGRHIIMNGYTFEQLSKKPKGRSIFKKIRNKVTGVTLIIYN